MQYLADASPDGSRLLSPGRQRQLLLAFMTLGLLARCVRYFLVFPLWEDECFLCVNFIDRGYRGLLEPLHHHQVAPPLFLWVELTIVKLLGFNELSLRLFAFLSGVASLFLFRHVAGRLFSGLPLVMSVAVFAVAYPGIRYSAEAKPYGSDLLVGLAFVAVTVEWWRAFSAEMAVERAACPPGSPARGRSHYWLWALIALTPAALGLSYPAVFSAGAASTCIGIVLLKANLSERRKTRRGTFARCWTGWMAFNVVVVAGFGAVLAISAPQSRSELAWMRVCWQAAFPPLDDPLHVPLWFVKASASDALGYPIGGENFASTATFLSVVIGVAVLALHRRGSLLALLAGPAVLHLVAAALKRYPYGGHVRFSHHMAASICLLAGLGTAWTLAKIAQRRVAAGRKLLVASIAYAALIGSGSIVRDIYRPYKSKSDMRARAFARWFWFNAAFDSEVLCVESDLGQQFSSQSLRELSWTPQYLCNKRIYAPRLGDVEERLRRVSRTRPLRCVVYRAPYLDFDTAAFDRWLTSMQRRYRLVGTESYTFPRYDKRERILQTVDRLETYKFVPRQTAAASAPLATAQSHGRN